MMLYISVVRPIPSANAITPAATVTGLRRSERAACRISLASDVEPPHTLRARASALPPTTGGFVERLIPKLGEQTLARGRGADLWRELGILYLEMLRDFFDDLGFVLRMKPRGGDAGAHVGAPVVALRHSALPICG